jgi:hypothetical protein
VVVEETSRVSADVSLASVVIEFVDAEASISIFWPTFAFSIFTILAVTESTFVASILNFASASLLISAFTATFESSLVLTHFAFDRSPLPAPEDVAVAGPVVRRLTIYMFMLRGTHGRARVSISLNR